MVSEEDKRQLELMESVYGRIVHAEPFTERKSTFQVGLCVGTHRSMGNVRPIDARTAP